MCEQDHENKKLVITKSSFCFANDKLNFRLSANRSFSELQRKWRKSKKKFNTPFKPGQD